MSSMNNTQILQQTQLETTPRVYYEHYTLATPNYDLYPSLSRRLGNGYIHKPIRPIRPKKQLQTNFISINNSANSINRRTYNNNDDPLWQPHLQHHQQQVVQQEEQENPGWDLYPAILRNVSKYRNKI
jgi:hypothetical protein